MKSALIAVSFVLCLLCTGSAFGQNAPVLANTPAMVVIPDHPMRASQHNMGEYDNLLGHDAYTYVHGDQPLSDFVTEKHETPLGDIARAYRKDHVADKKATIVMDK
jgi:hypothetical protein